MNKMISIDNFDKEIMKLFENCVEQKKQIVEENLDKYATELKNDIKKHSPKLTGDYIRGWRVAYKHGSRVIHNATDYQLTHLLEEGFVHTSGKFVKAKPHIRPAFDSTIDRFYNDLKNKLK